MIINAKEKHSPYKTKKQFKNKDELLEFVDDHLSSIGEGQRRSILKRKNIYELLVLCNMELIRKS